MRRRRRSRRRDHSIFSSTMALIVCGLMAGVVIAAGLFPTVAIPGLAARAAVQGFDDLPSQLTVRQSPQISYVYASDGKTLISTFYDENRRDVDISRVAPVMQQAIVAAEDMRFYDHHGVDVKGVARALVANHNAGETEQGASTLTMQYVRLALEYSAATPQEVVDATEDTTERKLREMHYALELEKTVSKREILQGYLNLAPFGNRAYGIYAAAEVYFGKTPDELTLGEAALLAGLPKAPSSYDPLTTEGRTEAIARRDNYVLVNMVRMGYITEAQRQQAIAEPLTFAGASPPDGCVGVVDNSWGFFCDYFYRWWLSQPAFGADQYERSERLRTGGYRIVTSLDVGAQAAAKEHVEQIDPTGSNPSALMLAGVQPGTGRIGLMAVNRNFSNDQSHNALSTDPEKGRLGLRGNNPNTTTPLISGGGDIVGYQAGSSFKVFTMVAALERGLTLNYTVNATSPYVSKYIVDPGGPATCHGDHYCPVNDNPGWMNGTRNMWTGLGRSVNTYWVPVEERVGAQNAVNVAKSLGIQFRAKSDADFAADASGWGAFTLGVSATTPLDMANAYASLAADGRYCEPLPVVSIVDFTGDQLDAAKPRCRQAVPVNVARAAVDAMRCPVGDQSAFGQCDGATAANVRDLVNRPVAGKTGTTDGNHTATLIVTTKQFTVGGIVADPDWPQTTHLTRDVGGRDPHADVVNLAVALTLRDVMASQPSLGFTAPPRTLAFSKQTAPSVTCRPVATATALLKSAGYAVSVRSAPVASNCPAGTVAAVGIAGSTATLTLSSGPTAPPGGLGG